jgi:hypothetical protein
MNDQCSQRRRHDDQFTSVSVFTGPCNTPSGFFMSEQSSPATSPLSLPLPSSADCSNDDGTSNNTITATASDRVCVCVTHLDDLNLDTLSTIFSYLPRRNDWTNLSRINKTFYHQYQSGRALPTLTPPPWPSCKALYDPVSTIRRGTTTSSSNTLHSARTTSHSSGRRIQDHVAGINDAVDNANDSDDNDNNMDDAAADEDDVPDFFDDDNPHHPLQLCSFSIGPNSDDMGRKQYLAVADKEGNLQLWHRCLGLIKSWNVLLDQEEGESCNQNGTHTCQSTLSASCTVATVPRITSQTRNRTTIVRTKPTLRYVAVKKDHGATDQNHDATTETSLTMTMADELLITMDSEGTLKIWRIHIIETSDEDKMKRPTHQVTFVQRSVGQWEPRMFITPKGGIILIKTKFSHVQHNRPLGSRPGMIRLRTANDPILGRLSILEMDRTTHHLPIHFEVSDDERHFLIYATKRKTPTSASVEFVLQTNHHYRSNHHYYYEDDDTPRENQPWNLLGHDASRTEQHVLQGTGTYHIHCETPQILEEQIERTCSASFFHRAALSPDGKTVAVVEFGSGEGGQQPTIRGAVRLVFRDTKYVQSEDRGLSFHHQQQQIPHRHQDHIENQRRDTPSSSTTTSSSSSGRRRCILLPSHSRYIKMSFSQDSQYLLVQFRHRARLGRSMKLYCRNLIVDVHSGRVLTSFPPFAIHAKSCEYFNHGPYRQLNSVRGTKVLFIPSSTNATSSSSSLVSVLSAGFVSVENENNGDDTSPPPFDRDDHSDWREGGQELHPWSIRSGTSHSSSTKRQTSTSIHHVPGFSITNIDLNERKQTRNDLMNLSIEELVRGIHIKLHRVRIPSAITTNKGRIVDWILQLHDYEAVVPMLHWTALSVSSSNSSSSSSSSLLTLSSPQEVWDDDNSSSSGSNSIGSRRDSIDSNSSHSESSIVSA